MVEQRSPDVFSSLSFRVKTPDGTMFVNIMEDSFGNPFEVQAFIGKSGGSLAAWAAATCSLVSLALRQKVPLQDIIDQLADITSDGTARIGATMNCRSGPEGIYSALIQYRNDVRERENRRDVALERLDVPSGPPLRIVSARDETSSRG